MNILERRTQRLVRKYFQKWQKPLGLKWWRIRVDFYTDTESIEKIFKALHPKGDLTTVFLVWANWEYLEATIAVNLVDLCLHSERDIERGVVHELMHVLVNEMRSYSDDKEGIKHEERVVTTMTNMIFWVEAAIEKKNLTPRLEEPIDPFPKREGEKEMKGGCDERME